MCKVLLMSDSLSSVWDHSVHFAKLPMLRFQTATAPTVSSSFSQKYSKESMVIGEMQVCFFCHLPNFKKTTL